MRVWHRSYPSSPSLQILPGRPLRQAVLQLPEDAQQRRWLLELLRFQLNQLLVYVEGTYVDLLAGGKLADLTADQVQRSSCAPLHNMVNEQAFGCFDYLLRQLRRATTLSAEGTLLFKLNHTMPWLRTLPEGDRERAVAAAMEGVGGARATYAARIAEDQRLHEQQLRDNVQAADVREERMAETRDDIVARIAELPGGIWRCEEDVHLGLAAIDEAHPKKLNTAGKRAALVLQLLYQDKVLGRKKLGGASFCQLSEGGKQRTWKQLQDQLLGLLSAAAAAAVATEKQGAALVVRRERSAEEQQQLVEEHLQAMREQQVPVLERQRRQAEKAAADKAAKDAAAAAARAAKEATRETARAASKAARAAAKAARAAAKAAEKDSRKRTADQAEAREVAESATPATGAPGGTAGATASHGPATASHDDDTTAAAPQDRAAGVVAEFPPLPARLDVSCKGLEAVWEPAAGTFTFVHPREGSTVRCNGAQFEAAAGCKSKKWKSSVKVAVAGHGGKAKHMPLGAYVFKFHGATL